MLMMIAPLFSSLLHLSTPSQVRSRALLSLDTPQNGLHSTACNWFHYIFARDDGVRYDVSPSSASYGPPTPPRHQSESSGLLLTTTSASNCSCLFCSTAGDSSPSGSGDGSADLCLAAAGA